MMNPTCRATVLMSVFNGEKFLKSAIDSILAQTYTNFEFVIYDDCSSDGTDSIIRSYTDSRIIYRKNKINQGLTKNLADGVLKSEADYIVRMDADDIAYPDRLEKQIKWMDNNPDITILGTPVTYFSETPNYNNIMRQPSDDATIKATLFISFTLMHPSIIMRRNDLVTHGLNYNPIFRCSQDHALYLDCIKSGLKFANLSEPLLHMRAHSGSISRAKHGAQQECSQRARRNFLIDTGIITGCTDEEVDVYNNFASGYFPTSAKAVHSYENFVEKIYTNQNTSKYFDPDLLRRLMAEKLCGEAYNVVSEKKYKSSAQAARRSGLCLFVSNWPLKRVIKYYIKLLFLSR